MVQIIKDEAEYNALIASGRTVIDFYADWCGPCKMMAPFFEEVAKETPDVTFAKLNVDEIQSVAAALNITSIPTMIVFENGKEVKRNVGLLPKPKIAEFVK